MGVFLWDESILKEGKIEKCFQLLSIGFLAPFKESGSIYQQVPIGGGGGAYKNRSWRKNTEYLQWA